MPSEKTSIATGVAIIDNIGSVIQLGGHTPRVVLLDTGAQPMILGVQFRQEDGHAQLQTTEIYVTDSHR